jgi:hypothetical protein
MKFDLNIQNYNKEELEKIFELSYSYNEKEVHAKESKLRQNILLNSSIDQTMKTKIVSFLTEAKSIIILNNQPNSSAVLGSPNSNPASSPNTSELKSIYQNIYNLDKSLKSSDLLSDGSTYIIEPKVTAFGQSSPSEFYQGTINPLHKRILKQSLNIDTRFRENYFASQSTNFHINLPLRFTGVVSMQLASMEFLSTYYVFSKVLGNTFFAIVIGNEQQLITINDGNYTSDELITYLNGIMSNITLTDATIQAQFRAIQFYHDFYVGNGSGRMIVGIDSSYSGPAFNFSLNFQTDRFGNEDRATPLPLKMGWLMGFRMGYYENASTNRYVSEGLTDLLGPRYLYLVVDDHINNVNNGFYSAFNSSILNNNILARISIQNDVFDINSQNNLSLLTNTRQYFGPVDIQKLDIQLLDGYGRIVDLNNMDYSFCLNFQIIYDL